MRGRQHRVDKEELPTQDNHTRQQDGEGYKVSVELDLHPNPPPEGVLRSMCSLLEQRSAKL